MTNVTLPRKSHAQGAVNEIFDGGGIAHRRMHGGNFFNGQLARQYQLRKSAVSQKLCFFHRANVALRAGMQLNGGQIHLEQTHVLNNQRIHTCVVQLPHQFAGFFKLCIVKNGVDGGENTCVVAVGKLHQLCNISHRVGRIGPRAEHWPTKVNRVCAVQNSLATNFNVACGG